MNSNPDRYSGIYKELAELVGDAAMIKIWRRFAGLNVTFPQKLYSKEFSRAYIAENMDTIKPSEMARTLGISERRVRQIMSEVKNEQK